LRYRAEKQTDTQTNGADNRTPATAVGVGTKLQMSAKQTELVLDQEDKRDGLTDGQTDYNALSYTLWCSTYMYIVM